MRPDLLLRVLQLCDSSFPTGAYAFSQGIEGLRELGLVRNAAELTDAVRAQVEEGLAGVELPATFHAHRAAALGDVAALIELDTYVTALKPIPAFRSASVRVGRRFLESASPLIDAPLLAEYCRLARSGQADGHHAVAFGAAMSVVGLEEQATGLAFGAGFVSGQIMAGVRLGIVGQTAGQRMLAELRPAVIAAVDQARTVSLPEMGAYLPLTDLAGLAQPRLPSRLFGS